MFVIIAHNGRVGAATGGRVKVAIYKGIYGGAREGVCESSSGHDFPRALRRRKCRFRGGGGETVPVYTTHTHTHTLERTYTAHTRARKTIVFDRRLRSHAKTTPSTSHV